MAKISQQSPERPIAPFSLLNEISLVAIMVSPSMAQKASNNLQKTYFCLVAVFKKLISVFFH